MAITEQLFVGELIEQIYLRFEQAPLAYGHGTDNAWDEAVYLVLSVTGYADDEGSLQLPVGPAEQQRIQQLTTRDRRTCSAGTLAWRMPFYGPAVFVEPGVMIPRSPIGYLLGEPLQEWLGQNITKVVDLCAGVGCLGILAASVTRKPM